MTYWFVIVVAWTLSLKPYHFLSVYKNTEDLAKKLNSSLLPTVKEEGSLKKEKKEKYKETHPLQDRDVPFIPTRAGIPSTALNPRHW